MQMRTFLSSIMFLLCFAATGLASDQIPGLLFHLSGDGPGDGFTADYAHGDPEPAYLKEISLIEDGAQGRAFSAPSAVDKIIAYPAPGNMYTQRGTLSFFFRNQFPVGETPFKLFYTSYGLHSSLDMTWLRVDYNGQKGYDAFVTDVNMARIRVSYTPPEFPEPEDWAHFALAWDETEGIRFYFNGELVAQKDTTVVLDAGLAFLKPFGRFATPGTATDSCGHIRGGDVDEIVVYDSMLTEEQIRSLAKGKLPTDVTQPVRSMSDNRYRYEWLYRHGWDSDGTLPQLLDGSKAWSVRKVEIHETRDQKKWSWRSNDGMRESVWPDVYNRSKLLGRTDYFIEPDWYCYSTSGKTISYTMPDEPFNYVEISGAAYGNAVHESLDTESREHVRQELFSRPQGRERTFHHIGDHKGGTVLYTNDVRETPMGEFIAYNVSPEQEPGGICTLSYTISDFDQPKNNSLIELKDYINKRLPADERTMMLALPDRAPRSEKFQPASNTPLPLVNVIIPFQFADEAPRTVETGYGGFHYTWKGMYAGLDGIAIDLPAMNLTPTHDGYCPMNITIKDPLWPNRAMMDFTFAVKPNEAKTIWFDTRDRVLPNGYSLYIVFSSASADFSTAALEGAKVRLVFKDYNDSKTEHVADRFTQVRDLFAADITETFPKRMKQDHLKRFNRDMLDLFKVEPDHNPGRFYWKRMNDEQFALPFEQPKAPSGVPLWAFRQVEVLKQWHDFIDWWIDERQIENGEFGGGLSDDGDFANCMPPLALMGIMPEKITDSMRRLMEAYYTNGMFTNGLNTIFTDALHVAEEGPNVQSELMLLTYGEPNIVERMMETSARYPDFFKVNDAGHRHITSSFYSSTRFATEEPWCWSSRHTNTILYPGVNLVDFNGNPKTMELLREYAEGLMAHTVPDANGKFTLPSEINYITDEARSFGSGRARHVFEALFHWTGDDIFLPYRTISTKAAVHPATDKDRLAVSYAGIIQFNEERKYIATEGFPWDDGPYLSYGSLVRDRLGGSPIGRSAQYAENPISWEFETPFDGESIAVLVPRPTRKSVKIVAFNLERNAVTANIVGRQVDPGIWEIRQGVDTDGDDIADTNITAIEQEFGRTDEVVVNFPERVTSIIEMTLKTPGIPYWERQDLGIGPDDLAVKGNTVTVTVHNVGSIESAKTPVCLVSADGRILDTATVAPLQAPHDLQPKTTRIRLKAPRGHTVESLTVVIDPERSIIENTRQNNIVAVKDAVK